MLALFALVNALEALRYLLPQVPFPAEMDNFSLRRIALSLHGLGAAIALLAEPHQRISRLPARGQGHPRRFRAASSGAAFPGPPHPAFPSGVVVCSRHRPPPP